MEKPEKNYYYYYYYYFFFYEQSVKLLKILCSIASKIGAFLTNLGSNKCFPLRAACGKEVKYFMLVANTFYARHAGYAYA